ncbi:terpene synthase family protein [Streptomyces xiamenensis]|nr:terpene synthase family protein [Streptomyces xiamenensis]
MASAHLLPPAPLPFTARRHPHARRMAETARQWAERFALIRGEEQARALARGGPATLAAVMLPDAAEPRAELAACWMTWTFFLDDQYEEGSGGTDRAWSATTGAVRSVLAGGDPPPASPPLILALADLVARLRALASPHWQHRFAGHMSDALAAVRREIELRNAGVPPTLEEYRVLRRDTSGFVPTLDILELCHHAELPPDVYDSPAYQDVLAAAIDVNTWTNDLYSLEKEVACGMVTNLVLVLEHERGLGRDAARRAVRALIEERSADLLRALRRLPPGTAAVNRCATALTSVVAGWLHWHATGTDRYTVAQSPDPGRPPAPGRPTASG